MVENGLAEEAQELETVYLINANQKENRYKLKPLVSDDTVYQHIVKREFDEIEDKLSNVFLNYKYIKDWLEKQSPVYSIDDILKALSKMYLVCIPVGMDDYPQKIFESINATGAKLTASDLIRNYILMPIQNDEQDQYYEKYWRKLENLISSDSKKLESFFRAFIMSKRHSMINKNAVYDAFTSWFEEMKAKISIENIFKEIIKYSGYHFTIFRQPLEELPKEWQKPFGEYRLIKSEMPVPMLLGYLKLNDDFKNGISGIDNQQIANIVTTINSYIMRRALCDMNTSSITRYFPILLGQTIKESNGDYSNIVEIFRRDLINGNRGSAQEMPDDKTLMERVLNANIYNLYSWVNIFFRKLESENNPALVDFSKLNIEHLMPQTATNKWLITLDINREEYEENVHRLGNLTLAAASDNSKMSNNYWNQKKEILSKTAHLKINQEILNKESWTINDIDERTKSLIEEIIRLYPYYAVQEDEEKIDIYLSNPNKYDARAYFYPNNGSVKILKGSFIDSKTLDYQTVEEQRNKLKAEGILVKMDKGLTFTKDYLFTSTRGTALSTTASLILHGSRNGKELWKTKDGNPIYMLMNKE